MGQLFPELPLDPRYPLSHILRIFPARAPEPDAATFLEAEKPEGWKPRDRS